MAENRQTWQKNGQNMEENGTADLLIRWKSLNQMNK